MEDDNQKLIQQILKIIQEENPSTQSILTRFKRSEWDQIVSLLHSLKEQSIIQFNSKIEYNERKKGRMIKRRYNWTYLKSESRK